MKTSVSRSNLFTCVQTHDMNEYRFVSSGPSRVERHHDQLPTFIFAIGIRPPPVALVRYNILRKDRYSPHCNRNLSKKYVGKHRSFLQPKHLMDRILCLKSEVYSVATGTQFFLRGAITGNCSLPMHGLPGNTIAHRNLCEVRSEF